MHNFLAESRNLNVKYTGRVEKEIEERRNALMDALLKIYDIFEGNPQIVLSSKQFKIRDLLKEYKVPSAIKIATFISKHFLNMDNRRGAGTYYSLKTKNIPNWNIVDSILTDVRSYSKSIDAELSKVDPRFEGLSDDAQLALGLEIIRDGISDNSGKIAANRIWMKTDIKYKNLINRTCISMGIYSKIGNSRYEWLTKEPFSDIINQIKTEVTNALSSKHKRFKAGLSDVEYKNHKRHIARNLAKKKGLSKDQVSQYIDTEYTPQNRDDSRYAKNYAKRQKYIEAGIDINGTDNADHKKIKSYIRYHIEKGKSNDEIYDMLISKPRYNRAIVDIMFDKS